MTALNRGVLITLAVALGALSTGGLASASPATFVTALPVAQDQLLVRFNLQTTLSTQQFAGYEFPVNIGYGLTSKWALFVNLNQGFDTLTMNTPKGPATVRTDGSGDTLLYARYTVFKIDRPNSTFRIAPLVGASLPTGNNNLMNQQGLLPGAVQTGSGGVDPYVGITMGLNTVKWGMAADSTYRANTVTGAGISPGSEFRADAQYEYALYPHRLPEEGLPKELILSIEANYYGDANSHVGGLVSPLSSGRSFRQDTFLEWGTLHWQLGAGAQIPVMQDLQGTGRLKERVGAYVFFEYYLAAPSWRHHHV
jgi:hypothetical protein